MTAPVLIGCSHGTSDPVGRRAVRALLAAVRLARGGLEVREAFVDVQTPEVGDVVAGVVAAGGSAVVVPLLLSAGYHVHVDIAAAVALGGGRAIAAEAMGPDPRLGALLAERLGKVGAVPGDAVVLAAAGSSDARAALAVEEVAAELRERWGPRVTVGYGAGCAPSLPGALAAARADGGRVVAAAYLLAPGFFHDRLLAAGFDLCTAPLIGVEGPHPSIVELVLDRYDAAAARLELATPS